jgi:hypothetical protein
LAGEVLPSLQEILGCSGADIVQRCEFAIANMGTGGRGHKAAESVGTVYCYVSCYPWETTSFGIANMCLSNPVLASFVQSYCNDKQQYDESIAPVTDDVLLAAAKGVTSLRRACLEKDALGNFIYRHLPSYRYLTQLRVTEIDPRYHSWPREPTSLTSLEWILPETLSLSLALSIIREMVEVTCPSLKLLNVSVPRVRLTEYFDYREVVGSLDNLTLCTTQPLKHLQYLGITKYPTDGPFPAKIPSILRSYIQNFVESYAGSLTFLRLPLSRTRSLEELRWIISLVRDLPRLQHLSLVPDDVKLAPYSTEISAEDFFSVLVLDLSKAYVPIESLTCMNIFSEFTPAIGRAFAPWIGLKVLRLGDCNWREGRGGFTHRGRYIQLQEYSDEIVSIFLLG